MTSDRSPLSPEPTREMCAYGCRCAARFYVGDDATGSYCCARHLAFYVTQYQLMTPNEWLKVCELSND